MRKPFNTKFDEINQTFTFANGNGALRIAKQYPGYAKWVIRFGQDMSVGETEEIDFFREEYIIIRDNKVEISEGLDLTGSYNIIETDQYYILEMSNFTQVFNIPAKIDIETELVVDVVSYADADEERAIREKLSQNNKHSIVTPNPSNGQFELHLTADEETEVEVTIYDNGGQIKTAPMRYFIGNGGESIKSTQLLNQNLPSGIYYIRIVGDGISEMQKIVIER